MLVPEQKYSGIDVYTHCPSTQGLASSWKQCHFFCHLNRWDRRITVPMYFAIAWNKMLLPLIWESFWRIYRGTINMGDCLYDCTLSQVNTVYPRINVTSVSSTGAWRGKRCFICCRSRMKFGTVLLCHPHIQATRAVCEVMWVALPSE